MLSEQVLRDLDILPHGDIKECLFDQLDHCKTEGGRAALLELCKLKNITPENVLQRQGAVKYISQSLPKWEFTIGKSELLYAEQYLKSDYVVFAKSGSIFRALNSFHKLFADKTQYHFVLSGTKLVLEVVTQVRKLYHKAYNADMPVLIKEYLKTIDTCLRELRIDDQTTGIFKDGEPSPVLVFETDEKIRGKEGEYVNRLIDCYCQLEALYSLGVATTEMRLNFPVFIGDGVAMSITGLTHPLLRGCVANNIFMDVGRNLLMITGPNMAGKSTFMKSVGLAFFMANLGMGIAASRAELPVVDEIVTSINIEDDLTKGYSYFFSEVQSVKHIAETLKLHKRVLVMADELFKGTNIKDAFDCSEIVIDGFLKHSAHLFILSTHLYELATKFEGNKQCMFRYFDGLVENDGLLFTHELKNGISDLRLGAYILKQEGIPELLNK